MNDLYEMELHDKISLDTYDVILRVPGGWIYQFYTEREDGGWNPTSQFVPFDNEFQEEET
jgi:hypothetical protein